MASYKSERHKLAMESEKILERLIIPLCLLTLLILPGNASAATHYVSASGSASWNSCTNINTPCSLSTANSAAVAGDIIILRDGTYTTTIHPSYSGTPEKPITYRAESQYDAVFDTHSYGVKLDSNDYIVVDGIYFSHAANYWLHFTDSNYNTVQNCRFYNSRSYGGTMIGTGSSYNKFLNNDFLDAPLYPTYRYWGKECQDAWDANQDLPSDCDRDTAPSNLLSFYSGWGNIIEGNNFGRCAHDAVELFSYYKIGGGDASDGGEVIVRGNTFEQTFHTSVGAIRGYWGLFEKNIVKNGGTENRIQPAKGDRGKSTHSAFYIMTSDDDNPPSSIIRNNIVYNTASMYLFGGTTSSLGGSSQQKFYHNTGYNNNWGIISSDNHHIESCYNDNMVKNNILYYDENFIDFGYPGVPTLWCGLHERSDVINAGDDCTNINYYTHNIFGSPADAFYFKDECKTAKTLSLVESQYPTEWFDNFETTDVRFTDPLNADFSLQFGSLAIDAGDWLTTITSSSASNRTSFTVTDANYFYDGWGIPGETGDVIKTEHGQKTTIQSINYNANTITVSPAIDIVNGEGLSLDYSGSAPDIGAIEYSGAPPTRECSDGIDNDGDGNTDYPDDTGCTSSTDNDETNCADSRCEVGETCSSCPSDCGTCPSGRTCDGLLGHYHLDGNATDSSGNGNDGTISGATPTSSGKFNGAYAFDGSSDYINIGSIPSMNDSVAFTVSAWVYANDLASGPDATYQKHILNLGQNTPALYMVQTGAWRILFYGDDEAWHYAESTQNYTTGEWVHLAGTYDGTNIILYVNGNPADTVSAPGLHLNQRLSSGGIGSFDGSRFFNGTIDEVAIWNRALSNQEISDLYSSSAPIDCNTPSTGPIAQWKFDEGSGTNAQDSAGSNDGTISGATWTTDSVSGTSLHFDGTAQIILPSSSTFIPFANSPITISAWFKADTISSSNYANRIFNLHRGSSPGSDLILAVGSNNIQFYNYNDDSTTAWATAITTGTWYHVVLTYDDTVFRMYLNGQPDGVVLS